MTLVGNIIWLVCGGFFSALGYILGGIALCLTVIGIPFGYQQIKIGIATLAPFGCELVENKDANSPLWLVLNVIWLVTFGWIIALHHLFWAVLLALTVVGLPFGRDLVRNAWQPGDERYYASNLNQQAAARR